MHRFSKEGVNAHPMAKAKTRRGARVVEEARLESVYTPKGYHEFESRSLRKKKKALELMVQGLSFGVSYADGRLQSVPYVLQVGHIGDLE